MKRADVSKEEELRLKLDAMRRVWQLSVCAHFACAAAGILVLIALRCCQDGNVWFARMAFAGGCAAQVALYCFLHKIADLAQTQMMREGLFWSIVAAAEKGDAR